MAGKILRVHRVHRVHRCMPVHSERIAGRGRLEGRGRKMPKTRRVRPICTRDSAQVMQKSESRVAAKARKSVERDAVSGVPRG